MMDNATFIDSKVEEALRKGTLNTRTIQQLIKGLRSPYDGIEFITILYQRAGPVIESDPQLHQYLLKTILSLNSRARELAGLDSLTGITNRHRFLEMLDHELATSKRYREELSLLLLDLDHFKEVNDTYGHQVGDRVLIEVAKSIAQHSRPQDTVARYGGEEYIVALPRCSKEDALKVAARIRRGVSAVRIDGLDKPLTITGGISTLPVDGQDIDSLVLRADSALYHGKDHGRNQIIPYSPDIPLKNS